ncbi:hypothetical protein Tco_1144380 [Tanacetum coccineum]
MGKLSKATSNFSLYKRKLLIDRSKFWSTKVKHPAKLMTSQILKDLEDLLPIDSQLCHGTFVINQRRQGYGIFGLGKLFGISDSGMGMVLGKVVGTSGSGMGMGITRGGI